MPFVDACGTGKKERMNKAVLSPNCESADGGRSRHVPASKCCMEGCNTTGIPQPGFDFFVCPACLDRLEGMLFHEHARAEAVKGHSWPQTTHYQCDECDKGILTLVRHGMFVSGKCDGCGRQVEFELPDEALACANDPTGKDATPATLQPESISGKNKGV